MKLASILILACFVLAACGGTFDHAIKRNGIEVGRHYTEAGLLTIKTTVEMNDQIYPTCTAKVGQMPGDEQEPLCVEQTRGDVARRNRTLNWYTYPYSYGYGYPSSAYASPYPQSPPPAAPQQ